MPLLKPSQRLERRFRIGFGNEHMIVVAEAVLIAGSLLG